MATHAAYSVPKPTSLPASLLIASEIKNNQAHSLTDGSTLSKSIDKALSKDDEVTLSFAGLERVSMSFLNGCLGPIYEKYNDSVLKKLLHLSGITPEIEEKIKVLKWRMQNAKQHEKTLSRAISGI